MKLQEIHGGGHVSIGSFTFDFFAVNHSIPDGVGVFIRTPAANVVHTGDFKLDQTPIDGRLVDYGALTKFAKMGVDLLMSDSTNAETPGVTRSEASVGPVLREIIEKAQGRVIAASFSSHVHRVQQICDAAVGSGRKIVVTGRSMITNTEIARELGYLSIDDKDIVEAAQASRLPARKVLVMCTGSQGEPLSALARMANGDHKTVNVEQGDTVVIAATPVPGNEKAVNRVINRLAKAGATVAHRGSLHVHVSGHAAAEELKLMLNLVQPRYFVPIHGETRHLVAHAALAREVGIPKKNVFVLGNGDCLELTKSGARVTGSVEHGVVYVDGLGVGDVGQVVLRDRQVLAQDGIATVVVTIDSQTGRLMSDPELITRGLAWGPDGDASWPKSRRASGRGWPRPTGRRGHRPGRHQEGRARLTLAVALGAHAQQADGHPGGGGGVARQVAAGEPPVQTHGPVLIVPHMSTASRVRYLPAGLAGLSTIFTWCLPLARLPVDQTFTR